MFILGIVAAFAAAAADAPAAVDPDSVVKCIREEVTGSLAKTRKVCHTVGEWRRINSSTNDEVRRVVQPGTTNGQNG